MAKTEMVFDDFDTPQPGLEAGSGETPSAADDGAATPAKAAQPAQPAAPSKDLLKELEALKRRNAELETSERYWAERAAKGNAAPAPKAEPDVDELETLLAGGGVDDDTAASLLDDIGEKGVAALEKRGVVTKAQMKTILAAQERKLLAKAAEIAESRVTGATEKLTAEAKLLKDYPELADDKSDFSKAVATEFQAMVAEDPSLKNSYSALRMAARVVQASKGASASSLSDRMQRIAAQSPRRGPAPNEFEEGGDVEISPEAAQLIAAGARYGLTPEIYKRSARRTA